jgi:hypothetical protein
MLATQRPHVFLDPCMSTGGELRIPFFWYKDSLNIPNSDWDEMGVIYLESINKLKNVMRRKLGDQPTKQPLISAEISRVRESERNRATYATHGYRVEDGISHGHVTDRTPMNLKRTSR